MKPSIILTLILILPFSFMVRAQSPQQVNPEKPYIEVTGTAEKEIIPDEIFIHITLHERYEGKTKISIEEQEDRLKASVRTLGIPAENLSLADANADYVKVRWQKKDVVARKDYSLKVGTALTVGQVFQELEKLQIDEASVARVSHSKIDSLRKQIRIEAIKAAKDKADYLLAAIGEQTGNALVVNERDGFPSMTSNVRSVAGTSGTYYSALPDKFDEIHFQKIKLQSSIYVKFAIK